MSKSKKVTYDASVQSLMDAGLVKAGTRLERTYRGVRVTAKIVEDGGILFASKWYGSPSTAASAARQSVLGSDKRPPTNGWSFWQVRSGKTLRTLADMRAEVITKAR